MRVTIGQINTTNGDYEGNTAAIIRAIEHARRDKSDLVVLPETCIQGYTSFDWFLDRDVVSCVLGPLEKNYVGDRRTDCRRRHGKTNRQAHRP